MNRRRMLWPGIALAGAGGVALVALAGTVTLSNKATDGDGRYWVTVDDYGAVDAWTAGYVVDALNPVGAIPARAVTFAGSLYVFVSNTHRELLADNASWQNFDWNALGIGFAVPPYANDTSLGRVVTSANVASDSNGDGYSDTAVSAFAVTGTGVNLGFALRQSVLSRPASTTAVHTLSYAITNNGTATLSFKLVRHSDGDLLLTDGTTTNDPYNDSIVVGGTDPAKGFAYVGQNEGGDVTKGYTLWSPQKHLYNATICGQNDASGVPYTPLGFTGPIVWTNYGLPPGWTNHGANIGVNATGTAASSNTDSGIYMQWNVTLSAGQSTTIMMLYTYGGIPRIGLPGTLIILNPQE